MRQFLLLQIIEITLRWSQVKSLEPLLKLYKEPLIIYRRWGGGGGRGGGGFFFFWGGGEGGGGRGVDDFFFFWWGGRGLMVFMGSGASISRSQQRIKGERDY